MRKVFPCHITTMCTIWCMFAARPPVSHECKPGLVIWVADIARGIWLIFCNELELWSAARYKNIHNIRTLYNRCSGTILCRRLANERRRYNVTLFPIGWTDTQNDPRCLMNVLEPPSAQSYVKKGWVWIISTLAEELINDGNGYNILKENEVILGTFMLQFLGKYDVVYGANTHIELDILPSIVKPRI